MQAPEPFESLTCDWEFIALRGYRNFSQELLTYQSFDFAALPPVQSALDGRCDWLLAQPHVFPHSIGRVLLASQAGTRSPRNPTATPPEPFETQVDFLGDDFQLLLACTRTLGCQLPPSFERLLSQPALYNRIRSASDCHFLVSRQPCRVVSPVKGYLMRFLTDSQSCPSWYLFVADGGQEAVFVSKEHVGNDRYSGMPAVAPLPQLALGQLDMRYCAASFEEFIYRFWIENELWYALNHEGDTLPPKMQATLQPEMQAYLDHYGPVQLG